MTIESNGSLYALHLLPATIGRVAHNYSHRHRLAGCIAQAVVHRGHYMKITICSGRLVSYRGPASSDDAIAANPSVIQRYTLWAYGGTCDLGIAQRI